MNPFEKMMELKKKMGGKKPLPPVGGKTPDKPKKGGYPFPKKGEK